MYINPILTDLFPVTNNAQIAATDNAQIDPTHHPFKDSGERSSFDTGANRDIQTGKGRFDLAPPFSTMFLARIYETGCLKYGDRNWEKGIPINRYLDGGS